MKRQDFSRAIDHIGLMQNFDESRPDSFNLKRPQSGQFRFAVRAGRVNALNPLGLKFLEQKLLLSGKFWGKEIAAGLATAGGAKTELRFQTLKKLAAAVEQLGFQTHQGAARPKDGRSFIRMQEQTRKRERLLQLHGEAAISVHRSYLAEKSQRLQLLHCAQAWLQHHA